MLYKIDRLTRSLADFAKIVEILDARGASFVSVTQQFNTDDLLAQRRLRRWRYRHGLGGDFALGFVDDSPLEEDGFEPLVPREKGRRFSRPSDRPPAASPSRESSDALARGTGGSNPSPSSGESATNPRAGPGERCIGLATEAARGVLEYAWHKSRLSKVYAGDHPDNRASQRILEKLGFEFIGTVLYGPTGAVHDNRFLTDNRHFLT